MLHKMNMGALNHCLSLPVGAPNMQSSLRCTLQSRSIINVRVCLCLSAVGHETEHWSVYRRYLEFYVLESKLTEFHGKVSTYCCSSLAVRTALSSLAVTRKELHK